MANEADAVFTPEEQKVLALALQYAEGSDLTLESADRLGDTNPLTTLLALTTLQVGRDLLTAAKALA